jgi:hypothetical protein
MLNLHQPITTKSPVLSVLNNQLLGCLLAAWLGGMGLLDLVVMPTLYRMGMMRTASFASVGEALFTAVNSLEIILGAIVLVAVLVRRQDPDMEAHLSLGGVGLPLVLLAIALLDRYFLTPQMGGLGAQLDWLNPSEVPSSMVMMHASYWALETLKLSICGILLNRCFRSAL